MASFLFEGTPRFEVVRKLGEGGMGVVYEAIDRERNARVALKTLRNVSGSGDALLRLKNEFRALQDLQHPNLVSLGELFEHDGNWFFTMELVDGAVSFLQYVRPRDPLAPTRASVPPPPGAEGAEGADVTRTAVRIAESPVTSHRASQPSVHPSVHSSAIGFDEGRLRAALAQVASGLGALHAARMVHRDIKPSNVLVAPDGKVTILDFGLVTDLTRRGEKESEEDELLGTVSFMAPEQVVSGAVGPEADWYSVGVMMFLAMTGRLPLPGRPSEMLTLKQVFEPVAPKRLVPAIPDDLDRLCSGLLRIKPEERPPARKILSALRAVAKGASDAPAPSSEPRFIGRARELGAIEEALSDARAGRTVTMLVHGDSGVGKTALTRHFVQSLGDDVVVLAGRCYERESVPYKAFDGVVDALSRYLATHEEEIDVLPADVALLGQAFPVLRKIDVIAQAAPASIERVEPQQLRARVFAAIREIFVALAARHRVVVVIDDLQWADADSLALLAEVMRPPGAPPLLLLATMRVAPESDEGFRSVAQVSSTILGDVRQLTLGGLPDDDARELVRALVAESSKLGEVDSARIAKAARGHPLFIDELVRHELSGGGPSPIAQVARAEREGGVAEAPLDDALWGRILRLDPQARTLVETLSIGGGPLAQEVAARAASIDLADFNKHAAILRAARLVKTTGARRVDSIEPYHDRIRRAVLKNLSFEAKAAGHRRLAVALEEARASGPLRSSGQHSVFAETLSVHWRGAGEDEQAAKYAALAADEAAAALAFDRAARLYFRALELMPVSALNAPASDATGVSTLRVRLGDALANAGRGAEAAAAYLSAAASAEPKHALDLQRRAADQLLRSGHIDEGLVVITSVLRSIGVGIPRTPRAALISLLYRRARLRLRGLGFRERAAGDVPEELLARVETLWSVAAGLALTDIIRGADFTTRAMLLALDAGEPYRIARALASEAAFSAANGGPARARTKMLLGATDAIAKKSGHLHAIAMAAASRGMCTYLEGRWRDALGLLDAASLRLRDDCTNVAWEHHSTQQYACLALWYSGELAELCRRVPALLREAQERGNLYAGTSLRTAPTNGAWLALDDPERAHAELVVGMRQWSREGFHLQHHWNLLAQGQIDLYAGATDGTHARIVETWPSLERSLLLRVQLIRVEAMHLRARTAIATSERRTGSDAAALLAEAARYARKIESEQMEWATPIASLVNAAIFAKRGDAASSARLLESAALGFDVAGMALYATAARARRAEIVGGDEGAALRAHVAEWARAEGVVNPERMIAMIAPGF